MHNFIVQKNSKNRTKKIRPRKSRASAMHNFIVQENR